MRGTFKENSIYGPPRQQPRRPPSALRRLRYAQPPPGVSTAASPPARSGGLPFVAAAIGDEAGGLTFATPFVPRERARTVCTLLAKGASCRLTRPLCTRTVCACFPVSHASRSRVRPAWQRSWRRCHRADRCCCDPRGLPRALRRRLASTAACRSQP